MYKFGTSNNPIAVSVPLSGQIGIEMNNEMLHCTFHYRFRENRQSFEQWVRHGFPQQQPLTEAVPNYYRCGRKSVVKTVKERSFVNFPTAKRTVR